MRHYQNKANPLAKFNPKQRKILLPPGRAMALAAQNKLNRQPVSVTKRGVLKCSGKWSQRKVAAYRAASLAALTKR